MKRLGKPTDLASPRQARKSDASVGRRRRGIPELFIKLLLKRVDMVQRETCLGEIRIASPVQLRFVRFALRW